MANNLERVAVSTYGPRHIAAHAYPMRSHRVAEKRRADAVRSVAGGANDLALSRAQMEQIDAASMEPVASAIAATIIGALRELIAKLAVLP